MRRPVLLVALALVIALAQTVLAADVRFAPAKFLDRDAVASSIVVTDADHDGAPDVVAALPDGIAVYYGDMRLGVKKIDRIAAAGMPQSLSLADTDRDGFADLVIATSAGISVAPGSMTGFGEPGALRKPDAKTMAATGMQAIADLDGDGYPDLVTIDGRSNALSVRLGAKDGSFGDEHFVTLADIPRAIAIADFDRDGKLDLAMIDGISAEVSLLPGNGSGGFGEAIRIATDDVPLAIATGDIDRNGRADLVIAYAKGISVLPNVTVPDRAAPDPRPRVQTDSLQPKANSGCVSFQQGRIAYNSAVPNSVEFLWNDPANWSTGTVPGPNDAVCIGGTNGPPLVVTGTANAASIDSGSYPLSVGEGFGGTTGALYLNNTTGYSTISNLSIDKGSQLYSAHQLILGYSGLSAFGGSIIAHGSGGGDAITVYGNPAWQGTQVAAFGGNLDFQNGVTVWGQFPLCFDTKMTFPVGATLNLNGIITTCNDGGSPTVDIAYGNAINIDTTGNAGIYTNVSIFQTPINVTGGTGAMSFGNNAAGPTTASFGNTTATVAAGSSLILGGNMTGSLKTNGGGTTITAGNVTGYLSSSNPLTLNGTLKGASDTWAYGYVTIQAQIRDHHFVGIQNGSAGGLLKSVCLSDGAKIDIGGLTPGSISTLAAPFVTQIGNCGGAPGEFRVDYYGGNLLVQGQVDVDSQTQFEGDGTITVSSGPLRIFGSPLGYRSAGHFSITDGTSVQIFGPFALDSIASFTGAGTLDNEGGTLSPQGATIQNLTNAGTINEPFTITQSMNWTGGTIYGATPAVYHNGPTIQSGATLNVGSSFGAGTLNGAWLEIDGTANFTSLSLQNHSTVNVGYQATANGQSIYDDGTGTLAEYYLASLNFRAPASVSVSSASFNGALTVSGGTLNLYTQPSFGQYSTLDTGGGTVVFQGGAQFVSGFRSMYGGTVELTNHFYTGSPTFNGSVQIDPGAYLDGGQTLIWGYASVGSVVFGSSAETLSLYGGGSMPPTGQINLNGGTVEFRGNFNMQGRGIFGNGFVHVLQYGNLYGGSAAGTTIAPPLQNDGSIGANGGNLYLQSVNNISGGTLTGGTWYANALSTLGLPNVSTNAASIGANGAGALVSTGYPGLQTNAVNGYLSLANGGTIAAGNFTNLGSLSIGAGSTFNPFTFTQTSGTTFLNDPTAGLGSQSGVPTFQAGTLQGSGQVQPGLQNSGATINVGFRDNNGYAQPGTLMVNGNYTETPAALVHMFLVDETHYSVLRVIGSATLAGTIQLDTNPYDDGIGDYYSFYPQPGDTFPLLTYASHAGTFATIVAPDISFLGTGFLYNPHYNANNLTFVVEIPDPKVMIVNLESTIVSFGLANGTTTSLNSKLDAAHSALVRGDSTAACGQLGAALNFTNAQTGKSISASQAQTIVSAIQQIQAKVGCH